VGQLSYLEYVGLTLNRERCMLRLAHCVRLGAAMGLGAKPPKTYFEAVTDTAQQAAKAKAEDLAVRQHGVS